MAKLTRNQSTRHNSAVRRLNKDRLTFEDQEFILQHWQEAAHHINGDDGAFFTPMGLAWDMALEIQGPRILDLCAGIGALAFAAYHHGSYGRTNPRQIVCVEKNPDYIAVGRKLLPEATWIQGDVFNLPPDFLAQYGPFDTVIGNPPFGKLKASRAAPRYKGGEFELSVIDLASDYAPYGVFIIPQMSSPFAYSGQPFYKRRETLKSVAFYKQTGIDLEAGCGVDCSFYRDDWHGVCPTVEIVCADFDQARQRRRPVALAPSSFPDCPQPSPMIQTDLFSDAA